LDAPNQFVDRFAVPTSHRLAFAVRPDRTVAAAVRRRDTPCLERSCSAFIGRRSIRDTVAQQVSRFGGSVRAAGRIRLSSLSRIPLLAPPATLLELVGVLTGS
jgi:hypothetical protein